MTRQDQFKTEFFDLLRRHDVKMSIENERERINFYSAPKLDANCDEYTEHIDLYFVWENGKE